MITPFTPAHFDITPTTQDQFALGNPTRGAYPARTFDCKPALVIELPNRRNTLNCAFRCIRLRTYSEIVFEFQGLQRLSPGLVLVCGDHDLLPTFSTLCTEVVRRCGPDFRTEAVMDILREWSDQLGPQKPLTHAAERHLWGTLQILLRCPHLATAICRWQPWKDSQLDFVGPGVGIACKTTLDPRRHVLSMDQLCAKQDRSIETYLVSLVVDEYTGDETLPELVQRISDGLADRHDFAARLERAGYRDADAGLYKQRLELLELWMVPMKLVPRVRNIDSGVSGIRFNIDRLTLKPHKLKHEAERAVLHTLTS